MCGDYALLYPNYGVESSYSQIAPIAVTAAQRESGNDASIQLNEAIAMAAGRRRAALLRAKSRQKVGGRRGGNMNAGRIIGQTLRY